MEREQRTEEDVEKERRAEDKRLRQRERIPELKVQHLVEAIRRELWCERIRPNNWHTELCRELLSEFGTRNTIELLLNQQSQGRRLIPKLDLRDVIELLLNQQSPGTRLLPDPSRSDLIEFLLNPQPQRTRLPQRLLDFWGNRLRIQASAGRLLAMNAFRSAPRETHVCCSDPVLEKEKIEDVMRDMLSRLILGDDGEAAGLPRPSTAYPTPEDYPTTDSHRRGPAQRVPATTILQTQATMVIRLQKRGDR